ncbi:hypothetical protein SAMN04488058_10549 [Deinococcus reticulitermitis]|uniref:Lipoprotein n=1 Tax=Deinococcus reticulitermitis TaxID=856736 RepID=A0A1H6XDF1_9DEIO|nr:hypothetical protein [Deinococcus reticulitermitis]SEJ22920.1 hypothetical protein SAMN04488058_10549 [Deinococcus reticulitermitis]
MRPFWLSLRSVHLLGVALLLSACAPRVSSTATGPAAGPLGEAGFRAAFSDFGVAWVSGARACVARAPGYRPQCPRLGPAVDVAWSGGDAWAAVPGAGLAVTLDRAPRSLSVGAVVALSAQRLYREDGSALTYAGEAAAGVAGAPGAAVTGGDGAEYVVLAGRLRRVADRADLGSAQPYLFATPDGAKTANLPSAEDAAGRYQLSGTALERVLAGVVVARVPHGPGRVGQVGAEVVTVSPAGAVRRFTPALQELSP